MADPVDPVPVLAARKAAAAVKALTLWQPWATLVAAGVKRIETRGWATKYRGPLAIHAAARRPKPEEAWLLVLAGVAPAAVPLVWAKEEPLIPYGAVVATCRLADCAPIGDAQTGLHSRPRTVPSGSPVVVRRDPMWDGDSESLIFDHPSGGCSDVSDQLPYGDWTTGRWAWLLEDIEPLAHPVPARGRQGLWTWDEESIYDLWPETTVGR